MKFSSIPRSLRPKNATSKAFTKSALRKSRIRSTQASIYQQRSRNGKWRLVGSICNSVVQLAEKAAGNQFGNEALLLFGTQFLPEEGVD